MDIICITNDIINVTDIINIINDINVVIIGIMIILLFPIPTLLYNDITISLYYCIIIGLY